MQQVFHCYPQVEKVIIYGSRAKGNFRIGSDIDLTLLGENLNGSVLSHILVDLDDLNTPYMLDVSLFKDIGSKDLLDHIARMGKVFYSREIA
ncbi:nucleotidyltransferase domain-containing protein [Thiomicrorhabdus aquaedulcis]|uniref:nucleotidyltransferase domain-containing protein n=1 Tax=Thiomicrorhabdus aquaedulcis TaxID=2211106 RepID=UPI000FD8B784|nr:nucleotidyltransferase domain-containing protein [Thiomicrorhabdus aquaedulcis]